MSTRALAGAVVPQAPPQYDQAYMARLVDVLNKIVEQLTRPQQLTGATLVLTDLPHETPRQEINGEPLEGEIYTKVCSGCAAVVLAINQTLPELNRADRRKNRVGRSADVP